MLESSLAYALCGDRIPSIDYEDGSDSDEGEFANENKFPADDNKILKWT